MKTLWVALCVLGISLMAAVPGWTATNSSIRPVFAVYTYNVATLELVSFGVGFFIDSDGTALTASHVVAGALAQPDKYGLVAIICCGMAGGDMFDLAVICATPVDPKQQYWTQEVSVKGDIAHVKIAPFDKPFHRLTYTAYGTALEIGQAHEGPMPAVPSLTLSDRNAAESDVVTIEGTTERTGRVEQVMEMRYHVFSIRSPSPPSPGYSGSPVLNTQGQVVGMFTWGSEGDATIGFAQTLSGLKRPCP